MSLHPDFIAELRKHFTGDLRLDRAARILYSTDASIYQIEPLGVVIPRTQEDLIAAVELAARYRIPILPRGAGTSLAGQAIGAALILDCSRWLDKIVDLNSEARTVTVEPGVVLANLNKTAAKHGLMFGPDPASAERATLGGVIGNNATGAHSILYGMTADHLLSADVLLSDGSLATCDDSILDIRSSNNDSRISNIVSAVHTIRAQYANAIQQHYPRSWRNSAGYRLNYLIPWSPSSPKLWSEPERSSVYDQGSTVNLASLLAGSEGTLAVIRRATLNLVPKPKHTVLVVLAYDNIASACEDVPRLLEHKPSAVELIPRIIIQQARNVAAYARQMEWIDSDPAALLVVEFAGDNLYELESKARRVGKVLRLALAPDEQARIWNVRKVGLGLLDSQARAARPVAFIEDCAVPVEHLATFVREIEALLAQHNTEGGIYAHASAGCLHIRPILNLKTSEGVRALRQIAEATLAIVLRLGGAMSSEHGDGLLRSEFLEQTYGNDVMGAMRLLKRSADPHNLLNPGKIIDAPRLDSNLRYGEHYRPAAWTPALDFSWRNGLLGAIEQCNGQGVCRKDTGVMCPSFQATREESNSTRGRANLLRAFITNPASIVNQKFEIENDVAAALDLCLACKGCKAECPSGVDMAKLKYEFEHHYYKSHPRPVRDYVFGYFHITAEILASCAPLVNLATRLSPIRTLTARLLALTPERPFPKFSLFRARPVHRDDASRKIIFLADAFSHYSEPQIEQAAFDLLDALGYAVIVLPVIGAGAALMSKGLLDAAARHAANVLDALDRLDPERALPVVGLEPPEIYLLKNDYLALLPQRRAEIERRASTVWLLEEYLLRSEAFGKKSASLQTAKHPAGKIIFQPHCHQRAEGLSADGKPAGAPATVEALRACRYEVEVIDAGCCGMAGTFGIEAEHYALSMQVGELSVFPKIRAWLKSSAASHQSPIANRQSSIINHKSNILATGAACRMHIAHGTGASAVHPVALLAEALSK